MPARGVESRDSKSSGKNETSFHSTPYWWSFERASGVERKANLRGIKRDMFGFTSEKKRVCALLCLAVVCACDAINMHFQMRVGYFLHYFVIVVGLFRASTTRL